MSPGDRLQQWPAALGKGIAGSLSHLYSISSASGCVPRADSFPRATFFSRGSEHTHLLAWLLIALPEPGSRGRPCQFTEDLWSRTSEEAGLGRRRELIVLLSHMPSPASSGGFLLSPRPFLSAHAPCLHRQERPCGHCLFRGVGQVLHEWQMCWVGEGALQPRDGAALPQSDGFQKVTQGRSAPGDSFWLSLGLRFDKVPG